MFSGRTLAGKVAIVTGASRGIGRVIAARLTHAGAQTVLIARSRKELKQVADEIIATIPQARNPHILEADLRKPEDIRAAVRGTIERFGKLHILVNNAADFARGGIADLAPEDWNRVIETNLSALFHLCHEAVPHLVRSGEGDIVNIASTSARKGDPGATAYAASKFGMVGFSQALFAEVRRSGVRVTMIYPSSVNTNERELTPEVDRPSSLSSEDVADSVLFALLMPHGTTVKEIELWNTGQTQ